MVNSPVDSARLSLAARQWLPRRPAPIHRTLIAQRLDDVRVTAIGANHPHRPLVGLWTSINLLHPLFVPPIHFIGATKADPRAVRRPGRGRADLTQARDLPWRRF